MSKCRRERFDRRRIALCHDFDASVSQVPHEPAETELARLPDDEPPEPDALHAPGDDEPGGHAASRRLDFSISIAMGSTDSPMMARMTRVKFSLTAGMFPK